MPYGLKNGWRDAPLLTIAIMAVCIIVWLFESLLCVRDPSKGAAFLAVGEFSPAALHSRPWTAVTSMFFHEPVSIWHILFNMTALWSVAPVLESLMGRRRFLFLYMLSGLGGDIGLLVWSGCVPGGWDGASYGASGAIFGLFAAVLIACGKARIGVGSMVLGMLPNLFLPLIIPNIAWQAHLGGFLAGGLASLFLLPDLRAASRGSRPSF